MVSICKKEGSQGKENREEVEDLDLGEIIEKYRETFVCDLGGDPLTFGDHTPRDINLMIKAKENEWRTRMEEKAWFISWTTAPHIKKPLKPKQVFDYDKIKLEEDQDEYEAFENMFASKEDKARKMSETITKKLIEINNRKKENGDKIPIS
jgi:hypothetical protein